MKMRKIIFLILLIITLNNLFAQNVGIGTSMPNAKLDVNGSLNIEGSIRSKYSGTIVTTVVTGIAFYVELTIPALPTGWDFTNTLLLVSVVDGVSGVIRRAKLTTNTNIQLEFEAFGTGPTRLNYIVFKL
jgi:hypothetical protein